jgi:hypothetical protein
MWDKGPQTAAVIAMWMSLFVGVWLLFSVHYTTSIGAEHMQILGFRSTPTAHPLKE